MDYQSNKYLLTIPEFKGINTNSPRGAALMPDLLENVYLDRTGGYAPQWARSLQIENVANAISAGTGNNLFIEQAGNVFFYNSANKSKKHLASATLMHAALLMPEVFITNGGAMWISTETSKASIFNPPTISSESDADIRWYYIDKTPTPTQENPNPVPTGDVGAWKAEEEVEILLEFIPDKNSSYRGMSSFRVGKGIGTPPKYFTIGIKVADSLSATPHFNVYYKYYKINNSYQYVGNNYAPLIVDTDNPISQLDTPNWFSRELQINKGAEKEEGKLTAVTPMTFQLVGDIATAYHQGRCFIAPTSVTYQFIDEKNIDLPTDEPVPFTVDAQPNRVYFSNVTADGRKNLPEFPLQNYFDVPFKSSSRIMAMLSVGAYLYIFGDRELWVMTGDPARDARLESLGDSIGAVETNSVQQLAGVAYWLSDSGMMAAQGANIKEVGAPVRDQLLSMKHCTATIDFRREIYMISDGTRILLYHAREDAWTSRALEGDGLVELIYRGGSATMLQAGNLYAVGGEPVLNNDSPPRLPMRIRWPHYELGDWRVRKQFLGLGFGMDLLTQSATIQNLSMVDGRAEQRPDTHLTLQPGGFTPARLHTMRDGIAMSGCAISVDLLVDSQDERAIMRPPLMVYGTAGGDEEWSDYAQ